jgi:hypothetical protein
MEDTVLLADNFGSDDIAWLAYITHGIDVSVRNVGYMKYSAEVACELLFADPKYFNQDVVGLGVANLSDDDGSDFGDYCAFSYRVD